MSDRKLADPADEALAACRAELARLREERDIDRHKLWVMSGELGHARKAYDDVTDRYEAELARAGDTNFLVKENARLREEYEDLCVECSTSVSNMEQRAEKAEKELARLREELRVTKHNYEALARHVRNAKETTGWEGT